MLEEFLPIIRNIPPYILKLLAIKRYENIPNAINVIYNNGMQVLRPEDLFPTNPPELDGLLEYNIKKDLADAITGLMALSILIELSNVTSNFTQEITKEAIDESLLRAETAQINEEFQHFNMTTNADFVGMFLVPIGDVRNYIPDVITNGAFPFRLTIDDIIDTTTGVPRAGIYQNNLIQAIKVLIFGLNVGLLEEADFFTNFPAQNVGFIPDIIGIMGEQYFFPVDENRPNLLTTDLYLCWVEIVERIRNEWDLQSIYRDAKYKKDVKEKDKLIIAKDSNNVLLWTALVVAGYFFFMKGK